MMDGQTARMGGMRPGSCVVPGSLSQWLLPHVQPQSFSVKMGSASTRPGGVTAHPTALTVAMRTTVVSDVIRLYVLGKLVKLPKGKKNVA